MADLTLRTQHPKLRYHSFAHRLQPEGLTAEFQFVLEPDFHFTTRYLIPGVTETQLSRIPSQIIDWYLFHLGLIESFSYWKLSCPPEIVIEAGFLTPSQEAWWHRLLLQGMGEFFFVNDIDFTAPDFVTFVNAKNIDQSIHSSVNAIKIYQNSNRDIKNIRNAKIMIPIGGGKDSVVTLEMLKQFGFTASQAAVLELQPTLAAQQIGDMSTLPQIRLERHLDPQLAELNAQGYLNGHTPFSAMVAFITNFTALLLGYDYVAVSNERSSNEGNVMFHGWEINHQYSKTYQFESDFREYLASYGPADAPLYFSFVRPLYELQIAQLFTQFSQYHPFFRSCNVGSKTNSWCGQCAKCLFAYLILSAVMPVAQVQAIFGQDLLNKLELRQIALELLGYAAQKPLDCVGTHEETKAAAYLTIQRYRSADQPLPSLLAEIDTRYLQAEPDMEARSQDVLLAWNGQHHLPPELELFLKQSLKAANHV